MGKKNRRFWDAEYLNDMTYTMYFDRLKEIAVTSIEWLGMPDTVDLEFLEKSLFNTGMALFFHDNDADADIVTRCTPAGNFNIYNIPRNRKPYAVNTVFDTRTIDNSVLIYNNIARKPDITTCELFARRLAECERTSDINIKAQKTPVLVTASQTQRTTMVNMYQQYDGNAPFIFPTEGYNDNAIRAMSTGAPFVADKIRVEKQQIWNEFLTFMGIPNATFEKRERLIADEVNRSQGGVVAMQNSRLLTRQKAVKEINKMFGLDVSVRFRDIDISLPGGGGNDTIIEEVEENE